MKSITGSYKVIRTMKQRYAKVKVDNKPVTGEDRDHIEPSEID